GQPSPYKNFVDDPTYATPTLAFQSDGRNTYCRSSGCLSGSAIDHIILTNEAEPWYVMDSADHFDEVINEITSYVSTTSDHLPVFAAFSLTSTGIVAESEFVGLPEATAYPNPFRDRLHVEYGAGSHGSTRVTLVDILGRTVREVSSPGGSPDLRHEVFDTSDLAPGLYVLQVSADRGKKSSRLLIRL
ncbi:MAG: T9SS type A sorting domain-containing protein, partial [Rhodothermales bacterium]|nr:T9SS type A sorting domain-containing protein [Rhodothermales bacterium]